MFKDCWKNNLITKQSGNNEFLVHFYQKRKCNTNKMRGRVDKKSAER